MSGGQPKKPSPEVPGKSSLELKVERTALERDRVTNRLLSSLIPANKSVRKFVEDACKFAKITPPKQGDSLAPYVYKLQKKICKFSDTDTADGRDGKLGPNTFAELLKEIPQLAKGYSKETRTGDYTKQRRELASSMSPSASETSTQLSELPRISNHQDALLIGDSLMKTPAMGFYKGTDKYEQYHGDFFKKSRHVATGRRKLSERIDKHKDAPAFVVWLGTNDLGRSANAVFNDLKAIYEMILKKNPKARIVAITLLPREPKYQHKVQEINRRIKEFARRYPKNMTVIDMHDQVIAAQKAGHTVFYRDEIHIRPKISSALKRMLKDHLTKNKDAQLTDYLS